MRDCAKIFCSLILVPSVSALHVDFDLKCTGVFNHRGWWWSQLKNAGVHHIRATYNYEDLIARDIAVHWELGSMDHFSGIKRNNNMALQPFSRPFFPSNILWATWSLLM